MKGLNRSTLMNVPAAERTTPCKDEIVSAAQAGSSRAFAQLYAIYSARIYRTIAAITRNQQDAEDALQETFLRAYLAIRTFEGRASLGSWLTRIAINSALLILRKRRVRAEILIDPRQDDHAVGFCAEFRDPAPNPEQAYEMHQRRARLEGALRELGPVLYEPIRLRIAEDSSLKEIGLALNLSEGAVKVRLYRARLRLSIAQQR